MTDAAGDTGSAGLLRASALVGLGTALSRVTGFLKLAAIAYAIGFNRLTDTYNLANTTPNIVYELILGGVLTATLVPLFVEHRERGDERATAAVVSTATAALVGLTLLGLALSPLIVRLYTFRVEGEAGAAQRDVATALLLWFMPQMLFYGWTAVGTALLNARRAYYLPAWAPVLNNLVVSAAIFALPHVFHAEPSLQDAGDDGGLVIWLGAWTTAGIVAMTLPLLPALRRAGLRLARRADWRHPAVAQVMRLSGWTVAYAVTNQLALWVVLVLANGTAGGVAAYQGAFVFFQLPHGLFAVSLMTTIAPELASAVTQGDLASFRRQFSTGLRLMGLVVLPAAAGYLVLAHPIVSALLQRGALSAADAELAADVLTTFAIGLFGFSVYLYALRGFYSLKDTRTPFLLNAAENAINVVLALALYPSLGVQGLGLAYAAAYTVSAVVALAVLRRRVGGLEGRSSAISLGRTAAATIAMAAAVAAVASQVGDDDGVGAAVRVTAGVAVGAVVYAGALVALRSDELRELSHRVRRRRRPPAT